MIVIAVAVLVAVVLAARIVHATGGFAGRLARYLVSGARRAWIRGDRLSRLAQASGYAVTVVFLIPLALPGGERWFDGRVRVLAALVALTASCIAALMIRAVARRVRRPGADERLWATRELMYADADRECLAVLSVQSEQYTTPVGQRCWTVHHATGEVEDTWFAGQAFPVGSLVLATWTTEGARRGLSWLISEQLAAASRHGTRLDRESRRGRRGHGSIHLADPVAEPAAAEAEAILRHEP